MRLIYIFGSVPEIETGHNPLPTITSSHMRNIVTQADESRKVLYRAWIRTLHYRTLSVPGSGSTGEQPSPGFAQLRSILPCVLAALEREILETGRSDNSYHDNADMRDTRTACRIPPHFNFIVQLGESLSKQ